MLKNCSLIFACILISFSTVAAIENVSENKLEKVIKNYITAKVPNVKMDEITLEFAGDENIEELNIGDPGTKVKVLEVMPGFRPAGWMMFPIEIKKGRSIKKKFIRIKVGIFRDVAVSVELIKKQTIITEAMLKKDKRDVSVLPNKYFRNLDPLIGKETKISIPVNSIIYDWMIKEVPLIRKGSQVQVLFANDGIEVRSAGIALEDGYLGAVIKVKRKDSSKTIDCKVRTDKVVEFSL
ncbi:MAG: flagellar basal body P-ring formation chaperone FlgA [Candidatus Margulisiibacteriota bacterium]